MTNNIDFIFLICISIYLLIVGFSIGIKGKFNLIYSIDQVKMLQNDHSKKIKISRYIACIYIFTGIGLLITS